MNEATNPPYFYAPQQRTTVAGTAHNVIFHRDFEGLKGPLAMAHHGERMTASDRSEDHSAHIETIMKLVQRRVHKPSLQCEDPKPGDTRSDRLRRCLWFGGLSPYPPPVRGTVSTH